jgi:hypothetical protein
MKTQSFTKRIMVTGACISALALLATLPTVPAAAQTAKDAGAAPQAAKDAGAAPANTVSSVDGGGAAPTSGAMSSTDQPAGGSTTAPMTAATGTAPQAHKSAPPRRLRARSRSRRSPRCKSR